MSCKTCRWLDVAPSPSGRRVVRSDRVYACRVEVPVPVLPISVRKAYGFKWPPEKAFVSPDNGADCPLFQSIHKR
jgi:hypothetical protein